MGKNVNLVLAGRWLIRMDGSGHQEEENISVAVAGDSIAEIGLNLAAKYPQAELLAAPYGLIMPGLINSHSHAAMSCFRGLADDLPLMDWLTRHIFPREAKLTKEIVYQSALLSICEMIKSGTTCCNDMYLFTKETARAAAEAGMRVWIGEGLFDFPSPCYGELDNGFAYVAELFEQYQDSELVTVTVTPHAVYTCSPSLLQRAAALAEEKQALLHIHLAETKSEVNGCTEKYGCSPVRHLDQLGLLNERTVIAHGVMLSAEETALLAERKVKAAHCPESNMKLASGMAPVQAMLKHGLTVGIGTDGSASNNDVDMFSEMRTAAMLHKVRDLDPTAMKAEDVLRAATTGGAALLRAETEIGSIEVGKKADIIMLDMNQAHLTPCYQPISHLVYAAKGSDVLHSVINGQTVMRDRQLTTLDEAAILDAVRTISETVRQMS